MSEGKTVKYFYLSVIGIISLAFLAIHPVAAKINFNEATQDRIDLEKLIVKKDQLFNFFALSINQKRFGLGAYGRVSVRICDMPYKGRKLIDYKTEKGIGHQFLSNPSCDQTVLRTFLQANYGFNASNLSPYQSRKCILTLEKIFSPMLEYYTIRYEEKTKPDCPQCEDNEKRRLQSIINIQQKIGETCQEETKPILNFLNDLDEQIENTFQKKQSAKN